VIHPDAVDSYDYHTGTHTDLANVHDDHAVTHPDTVDYHDYHPVMQPDALDYHDGHAVSHPDALTSYDYHAVIHPDALDYRVADHHDYYPLSLHNDLDYHLDYHHDYGAVPFYAEDYHHADVVVVHPVIQVFDCVEGATSWQTAWTEARKDWCCVHKNIGCKAPEPRGRVVSIGNGQVERLRSRYGDHDDRDYGNHTHSGPHDQDDYEENVNLLDKLRDKMMKTVPPLDHGVRTGARVDELVDRLSDRLQRPGGIGGKGRPATTSLTVDLPEPGLPEPPLDEVPLPDLVLPEPPPPPPLLPPPPPPPRPPSPTEVMPAMGDWYGTPVTFS